MIIYDLQDHILLVRAAVCARPLCKGASVREGWNAGSGGAGIISRYERPEEEETTLSAPSYPLAGSADFGLRFLIAEYFNRDIGGIQNMNTGQPCSQIRISRPAGFQNGEVFFIRRALTAFN